MYKQKQAFTLVELIVVITILTILGTIAIMAFSGYSKNARDSARIADITNIKKSLELWMLQSGNYPEPTNGTGVTFSGSYTLWTQGTFGDSVTNTVGKLEKKPVDPLYDTEYTYSITNSKKEYEIGAVLEGEVAYIPIITQSYAATESKIAYVSGNYNGVLTTIGSNPAYVIALPSIILSDLTNTTINGTSSYSLVYDKQKNLPSSYEGKSLMMTGSGLDFIPQIVWTGTGLEVLNNQIEFQKLVSNLQNIYNSGSLFAALPEYKTISGEQGLTSSVLGTVKTIIETNTKQELSQVSTEPAVSCATNPGYANASYTVGFPTVYNQVWQNTNSSSPCYYSCNQGYTGNDCHLGNYFSGSGTLGNPWKKIDGYSLSICQSYSLNATTNNSGVTRGNGTCGDGTKECLSSGYYSIVPDGNESNKFTVYCDMTNDGGGWTLASSYNNGAMDVNYSTSTGLISYVSGSLLSLETRFEAITSTRTYKRFLKNNNIHGLDHDGDNAYFASCKLQWSDSYAGDDWGVDSTLQSDFKFWHAVATNKGSNNYKYNIVSDCHRSLKASDGSTYKSESNTYFAGWNAYCGGLKFDYSSVKSLGCASITSGNRFIIKGPEGGIKVSDYEEKIGGLIGVKIWLK